METLIVVLILGYIVYSFARGEGASPTPSTPPGFPRDATTDLKFQRNESFRVYDESKLSGVISSARSSCERSGYVTGEPYIAPDGLSGHFPVYLPAD